MSWIQSAFGTKISPIILCIIVFLAILFFIAALLHLLIRFLLKQRPTQPTNPPEMSTSGPFQRQLQQLFHLHDSGLDQSYIDSLPVFLYKDVVGSKEPFDCAVCLCEFTELDKLRLLPLCSHAFHLECIDTWLLSNSSCPLCRGVILSFENPVFYFGDLKEVESGSEGFTESNSAVINEKRVFSVRLGKLRGVNNNGGGEIGEGSNSNLDCRRCYSMGSFQYVVADSELQVALFPSRRERGRGGQNGNFATGGQNGNFASDGDWGDADGKKINNRAKGESFSVSKIWLWSKKDPHSIEDDPFPKCDLTRPDP